MITIEIDPNEERRAQFKNGLANVIAACHKGRCVDDNGECPIFRFCEKNFKHDPHRWLE